MVKSISGFLFALKGLCKTGILAFSAAKEWNQRRVTLGKAGSLNDGL